MHALLIGCVDWFLVRPVWVLNYFGQKHFCSIDVSVRHWFFPYWLTIHVCTTISLNQWVVCSILLWLERTGFMIRRHGHSKVWFPLIVQGKLDHDVSLKGGGQWRFGICVRTNRDLMAAQSLQKCCRTHKTLALAPPLHKSPPSSSPHRQWLLLATDRVLPALMEGAVSGRDGYVESELLLLPSDSAFLKKYSPCFFSSWFFGASHFRCAASFFDN